jgi:hypothetical protein
MLRLLTSVLIIASLVAGSLAAATAYLAPISLPDSVLVGKTINGPAGYVAGPGGQGEPFARAGTEITAELLAALRTQKSAEGTPVKRIPIKEFTLATWNEKWLFFGAVAGLVVAAVLTRVARSKGAAAEAPAGAAGSPEATLARMREIVAILQVDLPKMQGDKQRNSAVLERVGLIQRELVGAFADARPQIQRRLGIAGYAQVMDRFAAAERQLNRAWSAAADDVYEEAEKCIVSAGPLLHEAATRLGST